MKLSEGASLCLNRLTAAGYACYAVGGCVRDAILGLKPKDFDLCTSAKPAEMEALFSDFSLVLAGEKHGTVGVETGDEVVEITTFRAEGNYSDGRHPDGVVFVSTIQEDLARRDFTINAMAWNPDTGLCDPFGGLEDLKNRVLRAVGEPERRFTEDALRILRGIRFAARYRLTPEPETRRAMMDLAGRLDLISRERVFSELSKFLLACEAKEMLEFAPILGAAIPEVGAMIGFQQHSPHHAYDLYTHTAYVVEGVPVDLFLRWAALLHDIGKVPSFRLDENGRGHFFAHALTGTRMAEKILEGFRTSRNFRSQVTALVSLHMTEHSRDRIQARQMLSWYGYDLIWRLLYLQRADMSGKGQGIDYTPQYGEILDMYSQIVNDGDCVKIEDLAIGGRELQALGCQGIAIGAYLRRLLDEVMADRLENKPEALLAYAKKLVER